MLAVMAFGIVVAYINIQATDLNATDRGYIEKKGTFDGTYSSCPGNPSNCTHRIYLDAPVENPNL